MTLMLYTGTGYGWITARYATQPLRRYSQEARRLASSWSHRPVRCSGSFHRVRHLRPRSPPICSPATAAAADSWVVSVALLHTTPEPPAFSAISYPPVSAGGWDPCKGRSGPFLAARQTRARRTPSSKLSPLRSRPTPPLSPDTAISVNPLKADPTA